MLAARLARPGPGHTKARLAAITGLPTVQRAKVAGLHLLEGAVQVTESTKFSLHLAWRGGQRDAFWLAQLAERKAEAGQVLRAKPVELVSAQLVCPNVLFP